MAAAAGTGNAIVLVVFFPREQRQRAATIGKIPRACDDPRLNLEWKQRRHPLTSASASKAAK